MGAVKLRRRSAGQPEILRDIESMIALLDRRIEKLDKEIVAIIAESPGLAAQARLLAAVPGIEPTVLATLIGELPELGTLDRRRIASLAGLAPHAKEAVPGAAPDEYGAADERSERPSPSPP